jgi:VanZ family protein
MRKFLSYIAVILWMALIFKLSSQPAVQSGKMSNGITEINIKVIEKVKPNAKFNLVKFDHMLRKNAHFFVYLFLGVFVINALRRSGVRGYRCVVFALLICILYAASDELHQVFVTGRGAQVKDVIIDSAGACVGILVYLVIKKKVVSQNVPYFDKGYEY